MTKTIIAGIIGLILGVLFAPFFSPLAGGVRGGRMMDWNFLADGRMNDQADAHFIEQMIPHHEEAVIMADLALLQAEHPEIKTLANDIIRTQSEEINQMDQWYKSWFGKDVPDFGGTMGMGMNMMHGGMMGDESDVRALESAKPFDKAFIEAMIPHHQMAVMMAQMLSRTTDRPLMKQLAENIIKSQTVEINSMRGWYRQWYGQ